MNRVLAGLAATFGGLLVTLSTARADDNNPMGPGDTSFVRGRGYKVVPDPDPVESVAHFSNVLFLNRCSGGCTITSSSSDNSSLDRSSIEAGHLSEFRYSDAKWDQVVACVQNTFSRFDMVITDSDPGSAEHMEAMVAGYASEVGEQAGVLGVAPFVCSYGYIPRSISYTFANENYYSGGGGNVNEICATISQEVAHTWGLDHEILNSDPMTYADYSGQRQFADQLVQCGEYPPPAPSQYQHSCGCSSSQQMQNSVQRISDRFGTGTSTPPHVTISEPSEGASVEQGFQVIAAADETLSKAELRIDNTLVTTKTSPPWEFTAPSDLIDGGHLVEVRGYDTSSTPGSAFKHVVIGERCEGPDDCQDEGEGYTCVGGRCVPGSGTPGGLGEPCTGDEECFSGVCLSDGTDMRCVESCNVDSNDCPDGYDCLTFEGAGACWPGTGDGGGGGCATSDPSGALPIGIGFAFLGLVLVRRKRPRQ